MPCMSRGTAAQGGSPMRIGWRTPLSSTWRRPAGRRRSTTISAGCRRRASSKPCGRPKAKPRHSSSTISRSPTWRERPSGCSPEPDGCRSRCARPTRLLWRSSRNPIRMHSRPFSRTARTIRPGTQRPPIPRKRTPSLQNDRHLRGGICPAPSVSPSPALCRAFTFPEADMADYFTHFSCLLDVGTPDNAARALDLYPAVMKEAAREGALAGGFQVSIHPDQGGTKLWMRDQVTGDPLQVIILVQRCAEAFVLTGRWGFEWANTCSERRINASGGGAHVLDLCTGRPVAWIDTNRCLAG